MFLSFVIVALHLFGNYPTVTRNNQDCSDPAAGQHHISLYHFHNNSVQICSQMSSRDLLTVLNQVVQMYFGFQKKKCVWEKFGKDDRFFFIYLYIYIYTIRSIISSVRFVFVSMETWAATESTQSQITCWAFTRLCFQGWMFGTPLIFVEGLEDGRGRQQVKHNHCMSTWNLSLCRCSWCPLRVWKSCQWFV